jgi:hypothetical protein
MAQKGFERRELVVPRNREMVRTRSTASHSFRSESGTRCNASLPGSGAQGASTIGHAAINRGVQASPAIWTARSRLPKCPIFGHPTEASVL